MKSQLAAIELKVLVQELKQLENSRLDRPYDLQGSSSGKQLVLQLNKSEATGSSKRFLAILSPSSIFFSLRKPATSEVPGSFCTFLRKHLDNARLVSIAQFGSERILELVFSSKTGELKLVVELFSKGNVLLLDEKGIIIAAAEQQNWKDRTVRPGFNYSPPPSSADFASIEFSQFSAAVLSSEKDSVVKCLATDLGLSGVYAEELCASANIGKEKKPSELSESELQQLFSSLQQLTSRKPNPVAVLDDTGRISEVFPFPTAAIAAAKTRQFSSFSEAVEAIMLQQQSSAVSPAEAALSRKIREMEIAIDQQNSTIAGMGKAVEENTKIAEEIYVHYQEIKQVLDDYNKLRKSFTQEQLKEYFKGNKLVKNIDEKTGTITVEI